MPERDPALAQAQRKRVNRSVFVLLAVAAVLLVVAVVAAGLTAARVRQETDAVAHTLQVRTAIYQVGNYNERMETARRGYLMSGDARFTDALMRSDGQMRDALAKLLRLVADSSPQRARGNEIAALRQRKSVLMAQMFSDRRGWLARAQAGKLYDDQIVTATRRMRRLLDAMDAEETRLLTARSMAQRESLNLFSLFGAVCAVVLALLVGAAVTLIARYNRDLNVAQGRLRATNEGLEEAITARTSELSRANAEIQRFAYIVSHDLRSPLVNVLGFTAELDAARQTLHAYLTKLFAERPELADKAALAAVDEDLPEALGFIRISTEKMDRLINSILELSRQGRRTLKPEAIDMTALAQTVAATLHQRAEDAGATVTIAPLPTITSDRLAVEQILANLVENALKYLAPGRPGEVRIEGRVSKNRVEIDVIDNGRGIAPADHERIFDLFRRAGTQDQPGEGLGLANVRALAYRLGGRVSVRSQLDEGACFTLTLPQTLSLADETGP